MTIDISEPEQENTEKTEEEQIAEAFKRGEQTAEEEIRAEEERKKQQQEEQQTEEETSSKETWTERLNKMKEKATRDDETHDDDEEPEEEAEDSRDEELKKAKEEAKEYQEKYMRLSAEWENFRKRTAQDRLQERERATQGLVENLLPVIDDIERAIDHAKESKEQNAELSSFVDGVDAVRIKFISALEESGVYAIDPKDEPFDLNAHQAVGTVEDTEAYEETVSDVYQKGYRMGDYVLRPAMVTVTQGGPTRPKDDEDDEENEES